MPSQVDVFAGASAPETMMITVRTSPVVGTTVTGITVELVRPDGTRTSRLLTPTSTAAALATVQWMFDAADVPAVGVYRVACTLQPSGRRCRLITMRVRRFG